MKIWTVAMGSVLALGMFVYLGCRDHERRTRVVVEREGPPPVVVVEERPRGEVFVEQAPPPMIVEQVPVAPSPLHVWVQGYYNWHDGRYVWVRGHYVTPPHRGEHWVPDGWVRTDRGYRYVPGHWR